MRSIPGPSGMPAQQDLPLLLPEIWLSPTSQLTVKTASAGAYEGGTAAASARRTANVRSATHPRARRSLRDHLWVLAGYITRPFPAYNAQRRPTVGPPSQREISTGINSR